MVSMADDPDAGPEGYAKPGPHALRQPEYRRALPAPHLSQSPCALAAPSPTVDEAAVRSREPLADVVVSPGRIYVTLEIPGVSKETIDVEATGRHLTITARGPNGFVYLRAVDLPEAVDRKAVHATYHNGVLDITIRRGSARRVRGREGEPDV